MKIPPSSRGREYVDLTRPQGDGSFGRCRTDGRRRASNHEDYLAHFPRCVTTDWLARVQQLPPEEAALRIEYAVLSKQVAVMKACQLPGGRGVAVPVDPRNPDDPEGLEDEVEQLRVQRKRLLDEIHRGDRCADAGFIPGTVGGPPMTERAPRGAGEAALRVQQMGQAAAFHAARVALLLGHSAWLAWVAREGADQVDQEAVAGVLSLWSLLEAPVAGSFRPDSVELLRELRVALQQGALASAEVAALPLPDTEQHVRALAVLDFLRALFAAIDYLIALGSGSDVPRQTLLPGIVSDGLSACIRATGVHGPEACLARWAQACDGVAPVPAG